MDERTACLLNEVTSDFYRRHAASFSSTRQGAWAGWRRLVDGPVGAAAAGWECAEVLDVACGNLRFERFLQTQWPQVDWRISAVDNCAPLVGCLPARASFRQVDLVGCLLDGSLGRALAAPPSQLAVCFGFFHHVPGSENRVRLLRVLADALAPGGFLAVSFWQFLNSPDLALRAMQADARNQARLAEAGLDLAQLDAGDYALGWQDAPDAIRYCHSFATEEIDALVRAAGLQRQVVEAFEADGRTGNLNAYRVFRR